MPRAARGESSDPAGEETEEAESPPHAEPLRRESDGRRAPQAPPPTGKTGRRERNGVPKSTHEALLGERLREAELRRETRIRQRAQQLLRQSRTPFAAEGGRGRGEPRTASANRERRLRFLREEFSFRPRIRTSVPDFRELHRALQREASRREVGEATRSSPFRLRTSSLSRRHRAPPRETAETSSAADSEGPSGQRSRSWPCLSSLSSNTLPVHITDAVRKRESAIRLSQEEKNHKESEGVRWAELQRKKSRALQRSVNCRAKAVDPHRSLEETHQQRLRQHWQNNHRKTKDYEKELEEMKRRVQNRPYLFEQVTKHRASQEAVRLFQDTLQQFGLNEEFVRKKGEVQKEPSKPQRASRRITIGFNMKN